MPSPLKFAGICAWLAAISLTAIPLVRHQRTPGPQGPVPSGWPNDANIARPLDRATLLFFAHPRCPCTRASLDELAKIMARCADRPLAVKIVAINPGDRPLPKDFQRAVAAIPGVELIEAKDQAARFGAETSGHVLVYGANGQLLFSGGITESRGHRGDNAGADAVLAAIVDGQSQKSSPVFGCELTNPKACASCPATEP